MRVLLCALLGLSPILFGQTAHGAEAPALPNERLLQQELKQQQIRTTTQRVADQLTAIIDELRGFRSVPTITAPTSRRGRGAGRTRSGVSERRGACMVPY